MDEMKIQGVNKVQDGCACEASHGGELPINWYVAEPVDDSRISHMYCFKTCDRNKN